MHDRMCQLVGSELIAFNALALHELGDIMKINTFVMQQLEAINQTVSKQQNEEDFQVPCVVCIMLIIYLF